MGGTKDAVQGDPLGKIGKGVRVRAETFRREKTKLSRIGKRPKTVGMGDTLGRGSS